MNTKLNNQAALFGVIFVIIIFVSVYVFVSQLEEDKRTTQPYYPPTEVKSTEQIQREAIEKSERETRNTNEWNRKFNEMDYESRKKIDPNTTKKKSEYSKEEYLKMYDPDGLEKDHNDNPVTK